MINLWEIMVSTMLNCSVAKDLPAQLYAPYPNGTNASLRRMRSLREDQRSGMNSSGRTNARGSERSAQAASSGRDRSTSM